MSAAFLSVRMQPSSRAHADATPLLSSRIEEPVDGFYNTDSLPHNFEQKLENIFLASVNDPKGLNGRTPDLVIFERSGPLPPLMPSLG